MKVGSRQRSCVGGGENGIELSDRQDETQVGGCAVGCEGGGEEEGSVCRKGKGGGGGGGRGGGGWGGGGGGGLSCDARGEGGVGIAGGSGSAGLRVGV